MLSIVKCCYRGRRNRFNCTEKIKKYIIDESDHVSLLIIVTIDLFNDKNHLSLMAIEPANPSTVF